MMIRPQMAGVSFGVKTTQAQLYNYLAVIPANRRLTIHFYAPNSTSLCLVLSCLSTSR